MYVKYVCNTFLDFLLAPSFVNYQTLGIKGTHLTTVEHRQKIKKFKLLLKHFGEQTQAKRLVFMEKYASKHV